MNLWSTVTWLVSCFTLSPNNQDGFQRPLPGLGDKQVPPSRISGRPSHIPALPVSDAGLSMASAIPATPDGPSFKPPTGRPHWGGSDFECEYKDMTGFEPCSDESRGCWLRHPNGTEYGIGSNYEDDSWRNTPIGKVRNITLVVESGTINTDGIWSKDVKLVNGTYPGPWIQACWGDTVRVKVINKLKFNGTAVHFHGVRQLNTLPADGVPGITQCPIAPNDDFTYEFRVLQYGSSWYHSHYSVQYADGVLGPMTLHGPTSADWDEPKTPLLMTDWFHNSAFAVIHERVPGYMTALLNGTGDVTMYEYPERDDKGAIIPDGPRFRVQPNAPIPPKYTLHFEPKAKSETGKAKRLTVVGADFVPVEADKKRTHIQIGIGQRYTVIVEADPEAYNNKTDELGWESRHPNFWIRTTALKCFRNPIFQAPDNERTGILRYDPSDFREPITKRWKDIETKCKDEMDFKPVLKWKVPQKPRNYKGFPFSEQLNLGRNRRTKKYPLAGWAFGKDGKLDDSHHALQIDYDDPFFLNLWNLTAGQQNSWDKKWVVIPEDYGNEDWVFFAITQTEGDSAAGAAHPIHLHGHDFAILQYNDNPNITFNASDPNLINNMTMKLDNPMRRDVVLLPGNGWFIMAFKTDNPGSWLMHCHIAFHASEGLALQINERQAHANARWYNNREKTEYHKAIGESMRVCKRWDIFQHDCTQHWPGKDEDKDCWPACKLTIPNERAYACREKEGLPDDHVFQDDSGI